MSGSNFTEGGGGVGKHPPIAVPGEKSPVFLGLMDNFNKACGESFVHCGSDEQVAVLCLPFKKNNDFLTSIHDFLTLTACLVYVENQETFS